MRLYVEDLFRSFILFLTDEREQTVHSFSDQQSFCFSFQSIISPGAFRVGRPIRFGIQLTANFIDVFVSIFVEYRLLIPDPRSVKYSTNPQKIKY